MLTQLRSFLIVADEGSLNRAATRLRMSQPALSRQIQALETELGGRLFERTSTGVKLTAGGHALVRKMGAVLASYDTAMLEVRRLLRGESESLRIGYLPSAARDYLNEALARLRRAQPKTKLKLLDLSPGEQIAALRAGQIDVGLTEASDLLAREFYTRKLAEVTSCVVLPADHPLAGESRISIRQLKNETFVIGTEAEVPGTTRRIASYCRQYGKFRPRAILRATTLAHALEIIANENAVALAPAYMRHLTAPGVVIVPLIEPELKWELWVVWQRGKTSGALRALLDALGAK